MNIEDLWIGEKIRLLKSNRVGFFEGKIDQGKIKVRIGDKVILASPNNIEIVTDQKARLTANDFADPQSATRPASLSPTIDLHIETLAPSLKNAAPQIILNRQISSCRKHIEEAYVNNLSHVEIIHGKGTGALREEIAHLLAGYEEIKYTQLINNNGVTLAFFR